MPTRIERRSPAPVDPGWPTDERPGRDAERKPRKKREKPSRPGPSDPERKKSPSDDSDRDDGPELGHEIDLLVGPNRVDRNAEISG